AWLGQTSPGDWVVVMIMGLVGYTMKRGGWPRPPLVLALILGGIMEQTFQISMRAHEGPSWLWERPIVVGIAGLCLLTVILAGRGVIKRKRDKDETVTGEGNEFNPLVSLPLSLALFAFFTHAYFDSQTWPEMAQQFPFTIAVPAVFFAFYALVKDSFDLRGELQNKGSLAVVWQEASSRIYFAKMAEFFAYMIGILVLTLLFGQKIAMPIYMAVYLIRWGKYSPKIAIGYALGGYVVLVAFYDRVMHLFWHPSWLNSWAPELLPEWLPHWLFF
ncbi:MAG: hypothetical protein HN884_17015, partial [Rhodospirillaceae bacterium]|nr:hypothetical protein [Rhodospirillaceae bacterium]